MEPLTQNAFDRIAHCEDGIEKLFDLLAKHTQTHVAVLPPTNGNAAALADITKDLRELVGKDSDDCWITYPKATRHALGMIVERLNALQK